MSLFYNRRFEDIESIIVLSEEEKVQILNNIRKQIVDINILIRNGYHISDRDWDRIMENRQSLINQLEAQKEEYIKFCLKTEHIMYQKNTDNIDHRDYLRAFNNFMRYMQEELEADAARVAAREAAERENIARETPQV